MGSVCSKKLNFFVGDRGREETNFQSIPLFTCLKPNGDKKKIYDVPDGVK